MYSQLIVVCSCANCAHAEANFSTFFYQIWYDKHKYVNGTMPHFQNKSNSTKVHGQFRRFLLCHCHSHSTIQIPRFIGTPKAGSANEQLSFYAFPHSTTTDCDQRHFEIQIATTSKSTGGQLMTHFSCIYL